jgi:predicted nucleic acid-binding protein
MAAVFLDTGILLRLLNADDPFHAVARGALRKLRRQRFPFYTSFQNVAEFWNVSTRPPAARGGLGLELAVVERRVEAIDRWCQVLVETESSYALWRRLVSTHGVSGAAVHDARLAAVMLVHGVQTVLTLNDRDFHRYAADGITVLTPEALLAKTPSEEA